MLSRFWKHHTPLWRGQFPWFVVERTGSRILALFSANTATTHGIIETRYETHYKRRAFTGI